MFSNCEYMLCMCICEGALLAKGVKINMTVDRLRRYLFFIPKERFGQSFLLLLRCRVDESELIKITSFTRAEWGIAVCCRSREQRRGCGCGRRRLHMRRERMGLIYGHLVTLRRS